MTENENSPIITLPSMYEACKACITARQRIETEASVKKVGSLQVKEVKEVEIICTIDPGSVVRMGARVVKVVDFNGKDKPLFSSTSGKHSKVVYCPGLDGLQDPQPPET